ncbi:hypothetical protein DUNSADRAFT_161 [Dunaliella salina]|uniref:Cyanobacterial aminoacyl-tRNA synthetase CAAD domain-containing protein n=1 Tax=Dunaliella salina TaxID=3046 RepID=A0ABQ7FZE2_DUNSA|nr:hypothetical protein DUNSADRAFT_161 [Dunaliella salina]|eukprot:KAF5827728.1 hypothetical protein DUNSADRAFT_161 [Dunaliella salina]
MALKAAQTQVAGQTTRVVSLPLRPAHTSRRPVLVRAEEKKAEAPQAEAPKPEAPKPEAPQADAKTAPPPTPSTTSSSSDDEMSKKAEEFLANAQQKWDETPNSEKPAAIAIIIASVVAQVAIGASVDAVNKIPLLNLFLETIGFAVTSVYAYRYATDPAEREGVQASIDSFTKAVTGGKKV